MARTQTLVQLTDELIAMLDQRAAQQGRSRSELVREAIERYLDEDAEAKIDRQIVEGYTRVPPSTDPDLEAMAEDSARRLIEEEPW